MLYDILLDQTADTLCVKEAQLKYGFKGIYYNGQVLIEQRMERAEKVCVLAEELGHHYTSVGDILDQSDVRNRKQERTARAWAYSLLVSLDAIITVSRSGITNHFELAEALGITEPFLQDALDYYRSKYGLCVYRDPYTVFFEPLHVVCHYPKGKELIP